MARKHKSRLREILKPGDSVVCGYATVASGPGWTNRPYWIIVRDAEGKLREECLQPKEQPLNLQLLYPFAEQVHEACVRALRNA